MSLAGSASWFYRCLLWHVNKIIVGLCSGICRLAPPTETAATRAMKPQLILSDIAKSQPHAAFLALTHGLLVGNTHSLQIC